MFFDRERLKTRRNTSTNVLQFPYTNINMLRMALQYAPSVALAMLRRK